MADHTTRLAKTILGWLLVVVGIAALVLPGPGLLALFAGLALLSQQYEWAERRVEPVKRAAFRAAAQSVQSGPRILVTLLGVAVIVGAGVVWGIRPPAPGWWPLRESWWLLGGWGTGATMIFSGGIALALMIYSWRRFGGDPDAVGRDASDEPSRR